MGASWLALMLLGMPAHAQQPNPAAHRPDRAAPTPSAPSDTDRAALPLAPSAQTATGVAHTRPAAPAPASPATQATEASGSPPAPAGPAASALPAGTDVAVLAAGCANCHGPQGHPTAAIAPLAGLPLDYLRQRLKAFQQGKASDATIMPRLLASHDDASLEALARWFAAQEGSPAPAGPGSSATPADRTSRGAR